MIFQHTIDKVLSGEKTQTRRIVKPGDALERVPMGEWRIKHPAVRRNGRIIFAVTQPRAVQSKRGQRSVARLVITDIRREDVRTISDADAIAEGFANRIDFLRTWTAMHDSVIEWVDCGTWMAGTRMEWKRGNPKGIMVRPTKRYDAWVISFYLKGR